jgi:hypothetical protein
MKGMFSKFGLKSMLAVFILMMSMSLSTNVGAQTTTNGNAGSSINWLSESAAISAIKTEVQSRHSILSGQVPNSPDYNSNIAHIGLYKRVYELLVTQPGITVGDAVQVGLQGVGMSDVSTPSLVPNKAFSALLFQDAVTLLSN